MANYAELVEFIVKKLVTNPDEVHIFEDKKEGGSVLITIKVAANDIGRVIGKKGSTINAIRHVAKAASVKSGEKVDVDVEEEQ